VSRSTTVGRYRYLSGFKVLSKKEFALGVPTDVGTRMSENTASADPNKILGASQIEKAKRIIS
jgi:hypothetical protein